MIFLKKVIREKQYFEKVQKLDTQQY